MIITASTRPRNVKKGITTKKLALALGFEEEVGLQKMTGRIEFSAEEPREFGFLTALWNACMPADDEATEIIIKINGETLINWKHDRQKEQP